MLLVIAARDTDVLFGLYPDAPANADASPLRTWRIRTDAQATADELALAVRGMLGADADAATGISVLSTVPPLRRELRVMAERYYPDVPSVVIERGIRTGVALQVDNPKEVGPDRLVNALAAHRIHPDSAVVVVDFGTATVVDAVSARGELLGGCFAPGIEISLDALAERTAALRTVELLPPRSVIGKSTVECLQSGILYGYAAQIDGLVTRVRDALDTTAPVAVISTGNVAPIVRSESSMLTGHRPDLTLLGLAFAFDRNIREG